MIEIGRDQAMSFLHVVFEGPPGAGKTMLAQMWAKEFNTERFFEPSDGILEWFYEARQERGLVVQLYFLLKRYEQSKRVNSLRKNLKPVVQDYAFWKDRVYAEVFLSQEDFSSYLPVYGLLSRDVVSPDVLVLLDADTSTTLARIRKRNRKGEENLALSDITAIRDLTLDAASLETCPLVNIDTSAFDLSYSEDSRRALFWLVAGRLSKL